MNKSDKAHVDAYRKKKKKSNIVEGSMLPIKQDIDKLSDEDILEIMIREKRIAMSNNNYNPSRFKQIQGGK